MVSRFSLSATPSISDIFHRVTYLPQSIMRLSSIVVRLLIAQLFVILHFLYNNLRLIMYNQVFAYLPPKNTPNFCQIDILTTML